MLKWHDILKWRLYKNSLPAVKMNVGEITVPPQLCEYLVPDVILIRRAIYGNWSGPTAGGPIGNPTIAGSCSLFRFERCKRITLIRIKFWSFHLNWLPSYSWNCICSCAWDGWFHRLNKQFQIAWLRSITDLWSLPEQLRGINRSIMLPWVPSSQVTPRGLEWIWRNQRKIISFQSEQGIHLKREATR